MFRKMIFVERSQEYQRIQVKNYRRYNFQTFANISGNFRQLQSALSNAVATLLTVISLGLAVNAHEVSTKVKKI